MSGKFNTNHHFATPYFDATAGRAQQESSLSDSSFYQDGEFVPVPYPEHHFQNHPAEPSPFSDPSFMYQEQNFSNDLHLGFQVDDNFNQHQHINVNPADLTKLSPPQDHMSPNLLCAENMPSPGRPASPTSTNGVYYTPQHSRQQSLDPAAAYGQDWQGMQFQQHRRIPSDHSDVSSNAPSPFLQHQELLQSVEGGHSPFIPPQHDPGNSYGIESFSLSEQQPRGSPGHSPYISPRLLPTLNQGLGLDHDLGVNHEQLTSQTYLPQPELTYSTIPPSHSRHLSAFSDMGQADQFAPPTINIEPAPVSRQASFGPDHPDIVNSLSPPNSKVSKQLRGFELTSTGSRERSKSDVTLDRGPLSRATSPSGRLHSSSHISDSLSVRSHSPGPSSSRGSSPGPESGRIEKNRRASTSSINSREYILDLADPDRPSASPAQSARVQKHPATFQCTLCPKRFTRAYNLRSHLRTHTDERPFVCTVCGKAFARQHDRKRHEGLHSGEKKFVCRGELHSSPGQHWGCGRRFARADALGRHFRSEAGRVCIRPLLDEEAVERRSRALQEQSDQLQYGGGAGLQPLAQPLMIGMDPVTGTGGFSLPAALLAQYPALQNLDWSQMATQSTSGMDDEGELSDMGVGGSNGFDASSGGEYYDDDQGYGSGGANMTYGGPIHHGY